ncbi:subunit of benzoylsuccinyl-CoA thiolase [Steroidobacter denitrificans]|uniref:Subunit of benzoylsuccinyl-CoA thiolase n=1 Tax=Steroidobacter denitrificans TaxID=465721 RepID=A0A127F7G3_STEDE|nr:OB-fold domain-containing protein [Steroidobacter denitrificans]AMN45571.1 subunit of benzoylsuccinyl-CoA thiolase [Steroidobacter denitrificans]
MSDKTERPFLEGWFTRDEAGAALIGTRCTSCGTYYFPRQTRFCRNPVCEGEQFEELALSRHGRLWSYTNACYQPPEPFIAAEPFEPFAIAAVELEAERMIVLGPVVQGVDVDALQVGMPMELVIERLCDTPSERLLSWKWKPVV